MAGFMVDGQKAEVMDGLLGGAAIDSPVTWYAGLSTTTPASDGSNVTEPVANGYARVAITNNATNFPAGSGAGTYVKTNGGVISWPQASGSWGTPTHVPLFEGPTGGTAKFVAEISVAKAIDAGDTLEIQAGDLSFSAGPLA